jgi:O-methyltransferase
LRIVKGFKLLFDALVKGDEYLRFRLAEKISGIIYPRYKFSEFGRLVLYDERFIRYYESFVGTDNYHSLDRKYALDQFMKLVLSLDGDTAECGAFEGASSYLICNRIAGLGKMHHIFDSFEGLSTPQPQDGTYWEKGDLAANESIIRKNLEAFDFVVYHKGWIPEKFHEVSVEKFCFVHLDVDLYQPTLDSLKFFYDKMTPSSLMLCDDYGFVTCPGARKAVDEFFADKLEEVILLPTGQGLIVKRDH